MSKVSEKEKEKDREIYALRHQVSSKDKQIKILSDEADIKDAQLKAADMFISFLSQRCPMNENGEVVISTEELYQFKAGYNVSWKMEHEKNQIIIKTEKV